MFIYVPPALARRSTFRRIVLRLRFSLGDVALSPILDTLTKFPSLFHLEADCIFHSVPYSRAPTSPSRHSPAPASRFWVRQKSCEKRKHVECLRRASVSWVCDGFEGAQPGIKKMGGRLIQICWIYDEGAPLLPKPFGEACLSNREIFETEVIHVQDSLGLNHSTAAVFLIKWFIFSLPSLKYTSVPIDSSCVALLQPLSM